MRINTAFAAMLILAGSFFQPPAFATSEPRAELRLVVLDETNTPLPAAEVTIYTADGNPLRDVTADDQGVVVVRSMSVGYAQIHAPYPNHGSYAKGMQLRAGENVLKVTLPAATAPAYDPTHSS